MKRDLNRPQNVHGTDFSVATRSARLQHHHSDSGTVMQPMTHCSHVGMWALMARNIDTVDKRAEYAAEGIPTYLVAHLGGELEVKIVQECRLDWASGTYVLRRLIRTFWS
jgi:hypothetical protein